MFFELQLKRQVALKPHEMRPSPLRERKRLLMRQLQKDLARIKCSEEHGYYITVTQICDISEGIVQSATGSVAYAVQFKCLVLKAHKGEVVVGEVSQVTRTGFEACYGPFEIIFVHQKLMKGFEFKQQQQQQEQQQQQQQQQLHDVASYNCFQDSEGLTIVKGTVVRMRLVAVRWEERTKQYMGLATLNGHYLGPVEQPEAEDFEQFSDLHFEA